MDKREQTRHRRGRDNYFKVRFFPPGGATITEETTRHLDLPAFIEQLEDTLSRVKRSQEAGEPHA